MFSPKNRKVLILNVFIVFILKFKSMYCIVFLYGLGKHSALQLYALVNQKVQMLILASLN